MKRGFIYRIWSRTSAYFFVGIDQSLVSAFGLLSGVLLIKTVGLEQYGLYVWIWLGISFFLGLQQSLILIPLMDSIQDFHSAKRASLLSGSFVLEWLFLLASLLTLVLIFGFKIIPIPKGISISHILILGLAWPLQDFLRRALLIFQQASKAFLLDCIGYGLPLFLLFLSSFSLEIDLDFFILAQAICLGFSSFLGVAITSWIPIDSKDLFKILSHLWKRGKWMVGQHVIQFFSGNYFTIAIGVLLGEGMLASLRLGQSFMGGFHVVFLAMENIVPIKLSSLVKNGGW